MKTKQLLTGLVILLIALPLSGLQAQDKEMKAFWVHEDRVKPSMMAEYEATCKELIEHCKAADLKDNDWITLATSDFRYSYVGPINSMADLDKNPFEAVYAKVGKEKMDDLWARMDKCYDDHVNYILNLDPSISYQPGGINQMPEGLNYRKNTVYYVSPGNYQAANEIAKKFKELYTKKGSKMHYRVYRSGFGTDGTYFMVAIAAENPAAYETMAYENQKLLGEEGAKLNQELLKILSKTETMEGWMRADLSFVNK